MAPLWHRASLHKAGDLHLTAVSTEPRFKETASCSPRGAGKAPLTLLPAQPPPLAHSPRLSFSACRRTSHGVRRRGQRLGCSRQKAIPKSDPSLRARRTRLLSAAQPIHGQELKAARCSPFLPGRQDTGMLPSPPSAAPQRTPCLCRKDPRTGLSLLLLSG